MIDRLPRVVRITAVFVMAFALLFSTLGLAKPNEVTHAIPFALLPIALLLGLGGAGFEIANAGPPVRRDTLFALSGAVASFAILRLTGIV